METANSSQTDPQQDKPKQSVFRKMFGSLKPKKQPAKTSDQEESQKRNPWPLLLLALLLLLLAGYWYFSGAAKTHETKYAFASNHQFNTPMLYFDGQGMRFEVAKFDRRLLKIEAPIAALTQPKTLIVEDGELDFIGTVKKGESFIPLELFQIHNDRTGTRPGGPVTDCKTYLDYVSDLDTILVLIDDKHILKGARVGNNRYVINFCETTREHKFQILTPRSGGRRSMAMNGQSPAMYAAVGKGGAQPSTTFRYQIKNPGESIQAGQAPVMHSTNGSGPSPTVSSGDEDQKTAVTKVIFTTPRSMKSPWVYLNNNRLTNFTQNSAGTQVIFWVKQNGQPVNVRVGDSNCECQGSGKAINPVLELPGYCECRDVQVLVNLDKGLDRYRNKIRVYIDGQLTDIALPPAGQPLVFAVRKTGRNQFVELKLAMPDDSGRAGLFDVCDFTIPVELTTVNISPPCFCEGCPANVKISG